MEYESLELAVTIGWDNHPIVEQATLPWAHAVGLASGGTNPQRPQR